MKTPDSDYGDQAVGSREPGTDDAGSAPAEPGSLASQWREQLLHRLRVIYYPLLIGAAGAIILGAQTTLLRWYGLFLIAISALAILLLNLRLKSYQFRAWSLILIFTVVSATSFVSVGNTPGSVLSAAFALVLAAVLLERKSTLLLLACFVGFCLALTTAIHLGYWAGPSPLEVDPKNSEIWLRMSLVAAAIWMAIAFCVLYVVNSVERGLARSEASLNRIREEQAQRLAAVAAQQEAEHRAAQSQRLESLGRLAAGVAHDFNNALVVIRGWNAIRNESGDPGDHEQAYAAIEEATNQATRLAGQLLTFGRQEDRSPRQLALDRVIDNTAEALRRLLPAGIDLLLELDAEGTVFADESQLQQMLINLVINARDALPNGGTITIRTRQANQAPAEAIGPNRHWLLLEVEDNGTGMSEEVREKAFEPFFTSKAVGEGSGLGLSSVLGIVRQSEGLIELHSEPDRGTLFRIFFPAQLGETESEPSVRKSPPAATPAGSRVLVVEDDDLACQLIMRTLKSAGLAADAAADGGSALDLLSGDNPPYDLLCSDAVFPGDSLSEVIAGFRAHSPAGRILICSGYVPDGLEAQGVANGEYSFLSKPFKPRELIERIGELLG